MCRYLLEEDLVYVYQKFTLQLEFLTILHVMILELLLLVCLGRTTYLRVAVFYV